MQQQVSPRRLAVAFVVVLVWAAAVSAQQSIPCVLTPPLRACVHLRDDSQLLATTPPPTRRLPVLFVHGHNAESSLDTDFNYQKNWQDPSRLSFKPTLELSNNAGLDIDDYYIRFENQDRSISEDAADISDAIDLILHRHDSSYAYPYVSGQTTHVKVVIIAYSKGTLSSRLYLKGLQGMPPPRPGFNPVSEFIALAPPNHGIATAFGITCAGQQMMNGRSLSCREFGEPLTPSPQPCDPFPAGGRNFITDLNTPDEAPGSRPATNNSGAPTSPKEGTLYVTIFANAQNPDFVGSDIDPGSCQSRPMASNRSPNAVNIPLAITGANRTEVHQNTPHTPLVICKALYAAVHHRSPLTEDCSLVAGAVDPPIIPPPARAAAMLTLDFSGSMQARVCPGCPTRALLLQDAVELFIQLWSAVSVPSDRLGVNYFSTNVTPFLPTISDPPPLLSTSGSVIIADLSNHSPSGLTAMGGGLLRAIEAVKRAPADTQIRRVILFTDGMQNVNPMVQTVGTQLVFGNQSGRPNSNVPAPSPTPIVLDLSLGVAVDTIGIGAGEDFVGLLQEIANATGGRTFSTSDPAVDLRRFFVEELINALKGFSPQLVAYRHGSLAAKGSTETFAIESGVRKLVFKVSCKRGDTVDFSVARNGVDVTPAGRFINGPFYKIFAIDLPAKGGITSRGNWRIRIKGKTATAYEAAAIVDGGDIKYDALFETARPRVGDPLALVVRLTSAGKPVASRAPGTTVTMTLTRPRAEISGVLARIKPNDLTAFEPGLSVVEQKHLALFQKPAVWKALQPKQESVVMKANQKGEFRARILPRVPGIYSARITIDGDVEKIGRFSRTVTAVTVVRSAKRRN